MKLWTYRFKPVIDGQPVKVALETSFFWSRLVVQALPDGAVLVDRQDYGREAYRLHEVRVPATEGPLRVLAGPRTAWSYGVKVLRGDETRWQSHEHPHAYLPRMQAMMTSRQDGQPAIDTQAWRRNAPAIATDIALGLLFFIVGKLSDLRTAALVTAAVGLALVPLQWLIHRFANRRIDLLGGLALYGVVMMLLSAGFSWYFDSERAVQLKATVLGGIGAAVFALDACLGGRWMAQRLATYLAYRDLNLVRLSAGMAATGLVMAGLNLAVALLFSKDFWLYYTTWADLLIVIVMTQAVVHWARRSGPG
ncbi:MAG: septation protein IspZ [Limnohabitans sp.]